VNFRGGARRGPSKGLYSRDIRSGLDAGDRYTEKVCAGRRYIHRHLDDCGRQVFHDAFAKCGIASEPPAAGCPTGRDPT